MMQKSYAPNLEQDFRTHAEETIYNAESEDHGHAVDESAIELY